MRPLPLFPSKAFLAPMANITDPAFRSVCKDCGAGMTVTELTSAKALLQGNKKTMQLIRRADHEKGTFAIQLFGNDPNDLAAAAAKVENQCDIIDLNLGCPAPKVCNIGAGSQLLTTPQKIHDMISAMVNATHLPITAKMRIGLDSVLPNIVDVAKTIQDAGASMLTVHGRTRAQGYGGTANWNVIKQINDALDIPVAGNGDITSPEVAKQKMQESGVKYVSVGRATSGNPLLFSQINNFLKTSKYKEYSTKERLEVFERYLEESQKFDTAFVFQKLQAQHFTKGLDGAAKIRDKITQLKNSEELLAAIHEFVRASE